MNQAHLEITQERLVIKLGAETLSNLPGGTRVLINPKIIFARPLDIEEAIERAEDWLMSFARQLEGSTLVINESSGLLSRWIAYGMPLRLEDIERAFNQLVNDVDAGVRLDAQAVAGMVIVRELFHHGRLVSVLLAR